MHLRGWIFLGVLLPGPVGSAKADIQITPPALPNGAVGVAYSATLKADGCSGGCVWSNNGSLPPGLSLGHTSGGISGTPTSAGSFYFTITATDQKSQSASQSYDIAIANSALSINTSSPLPDGKLGIHYSQTLAASGGSAPYTWSVAAGRLPAGISLDSASGTISGTPTTSGIFSFSVHVADKSGGSISKAITLTIGSAPPPPTPTLSFTGLPDTSGSAVQMPLGLVLSSAATQLITGQVVVTFQPDAAAARDDPAIQFSTGSRTAPFTIPAGATTAVFSSGALAFQIGTVAGTLTFAVSSNLSGTNLSHTIVVPRAGPVITKASVVQSGTGFQVQVAGFSNTRELAGASFHFTSAVGQTVQTSDLSVSLAGPASQWYTSSTSTQFGGQFLLTAPFSVTKGAASDVSSVSVQLQNGQGGSASVTASF